MVDNIVPFGKYKGQSVEMLLADRSYLDWLLSQEWFRSNHTNLYQTVINYSAEPTETPEHNALQVSFLDDAFCLRFVRYLKPDLDEHAAGKLKEQVDAKVRDLGKQLERARSDLKSWEGYRWVGEQDRLSAKRAEIRELEDENERVSSFAVGKILYQFRRQFESKPGYGENIQSGLPIDVILGVIFSATNDDNLRDGLRPFCIEIKPIVSDDYPAVLRQMKANRSSILLLK